MRRREFIAGLGSAAVWPLAARAQQGTPPVVGYLNLGMRESSEYLLTGFRKGLNETGFIEGRNVAVEYRFADGAEDRLPELAADLVRRRVAAILASTLSAALVANMATATIPIVFRTGAHPIRNGLVDSFNRPGGNVTGINNINLNLWPKRPQHSLHLACPVFPLDLDQRVEFTQMVGIA